MTSTAATSTSTSLTGEAGGDLDGVFSLIPSTSEVDGLFERVLAVARLHLDLDVAWFSRFSDTQQVLEHVEGDAALFGVGTGFCGPYQDSYCSRVMTGELPNIIGDARADERTRDLAITTDLGIGAYAGVPVVLADGEVYGMMCALGREANEQISPKDLKFMRVLAEILAAEVEQRRPAEELRQATVRRIEDAIAGRGLRMVFQPIVRLDTLAVVGVESLSRFGGAPSSPDLWFRDAVAVGRGADLELTSLRLAMAALPDIPDDVYLSVNASPEVISLWADRSLPDGVPYHRLLLEITEHAPIADYDLLERALARLRERGVRIAIDDAGAGYSSFRHILQIGPDVIKLDLTITRDVDQDPSRRALATAFVSFAADIGATLVAEGVETTAELQTLRRLGVTHAQGYLFAKPSDLPIPRISEDVNRDTAAPRVVTTQPAGSRISRRTRLAGKTAA